MNSSKPALDSVTLLRRSGFTMLELMLVLLILGILIGAFVMAGASAFTKSSEKETRIRLTELATMVEVFHQVEGQYPNDRLPGGVVGNQTNAASEALFLALFDPEYQGQRPNEEWLVNTDGDVLRKPITILPDRQLFEVGDTWGNPILYFESLHYGDKVVTLAGPEQDFFEQEYSAVSSDRTSGWKAAGRFQLLSAGEDGTFGTEDDLSNFERG